MTKLAPERPSDQKPSTLPLDYGARPRYLRDGLIFIYCYLWAGLIFIYCYLWAGLIFIYCYLWAGLIFIYCYLWAGLLFIYSYFWAGLIFIYCYLWAGLLFIYSYLWAGLIFIYCYLWAWLLFIYCYLRDGAHILYITSELGLSRRYSEYRDGCENRTFWANQIRTALLCRRWLVSASYHSVAGPLETANNIRYQNQSHDVLIYYDLHN